MFREDYTGRIVLEPNIDFEITEIEDNNFKKFLFKDLEIGNVDELEGDYKLKIELSIPAATKKEFNNAAVKEFIPLYFEIGSIKEIREKKEFSIEIKDVSSKHPTPNVEEIIILDQSRKIIAYSNKIFFTQEERIKNQFLEIVNGNTGDSLYVLEMPSENSEYGIRLKIHEKIFKDFNGSFLEPLIFKAAFERILMTLIMTENESDLFLWEKLNKYVSDKLVGGYDDFFPDSYTNYDNPDIRKISEPMRNEFIDQFMSDNFTGLLNLYERLIEIERKKNGQ